MRLLEIQQHFFRMKNFNAQKIRIYSKHTYINHSYLTIILLLFLKIALHWLDDTSFPLSNYISALPHQR